MRIVVAGGTGFIGRALVTDLVRAGHEVIVFTRRLGGNRGIDHREGVRFVEWDPRGGARTDSDESIRRVIEAVDGTDAVVNLAGAVIARRWTARSKELIVSSRVDATRTLVQAVTSAASPPGVFVSASAVGYYGSRGDLMVTEDSPAGADFLADVCRRWEAEAEKVARVDAAPAEGRIRLVLPRIGLVLGDGGALRMMALPFRLFVGGPLGSGEQWMPWIHLDDAVGLIRFAIENEQVHGPLNVTGPNPVRNREFARILGEVLGRPSFMPAPAFAMRAVLGEMADMVLTGQRAVPDKALAAGYGFRYTDAKAALRDVLK